MEREPYGCLRYFLVWNMVIYGDYTNYETMKRTPLRRVSKKRVKANAEYAKRRIAFLAAHPYCQWWLAENGDGCTLSEDYAFKHEGFFMLNSIPCRCPRSTEIHHTRKPRCKYLNDESTWMAVSAEGHRAIESNLKLAREKGYSFY